MSSLDRIKEIMFISEQSEEKKVVTAPVPIAVLIKILLKEMSKDPDIFEGPLDISYNQDTSIMDTMKTLKYAGVDDTHLNRDFVRAFIENNDAKLKQGITDPSEYYLPKVKKFQAIGDETYTARKYDTYELLVECYDENYIRDLIGNGLDIYDGKLIREEIADTWDTDTELFSIEEVTNSTNESFIPRKTQNIKENIKKYVNSENNIQKLQEINELLSKRINELNKGK